jgi:hypothetical protein
MKQRLMSVALAACFVALARPTIARGQTPASANAWPADPAVPDQFRSLYRELDDALRQGNQAYSFNKLAARPLGVPYLFVSPAVLRPVASDSSAWHDLLATIDAFRAMRMDGVSVMIAAPFLTVGDPKALIDVYRRIGTEVHARGMKLYVEHFVSPPFGPYAVTGFRDDPQGRKDFLDMMEKEVSLIYRDIRPDYLSLVTEPETLRRWTHLSLSADEWATWVGTVAARLKATNASPGTLLGAGAGTGESEDFVLAFARQAPLDYVDFHFYALSLNGDDQLAKLSTLVHRAREIRPNIGITIGEAWLYKHGAAEPKGMMNTEAFARDNFGFWAPLDERFLRVLWGIAQRERIAVVAPYFSQYFFSYYTFGTVESSQLPPWPASVPVSWGKALDAIRNRQLSTTGKAISAMLDDGRSR